MEEIRGGGHVAEEGIRQSGGIHDLPAALAVLKADADRNGLRVCVLLKGFSQKRDAFTGES